MKTRWFLPVFSLTALLFTQSVFAVQTCAQKEAAINEQLRLARQHNHRYQAAGLEQALAKVQTECTTQSVRQQASQDVQKLKGKLAAKQQDLQEAKDDMQQATAKGNEEKIAKYQRKMVQKQGDIEKLNRQLAQAQHALAELK